VRSKKRFESRDITEYSKSWGVTEVIGPETYGLFFVTRNGVRFAVLAEDPNMAACETWWDGYLKIMSKESSLYKKLDDAYRKAMLG
jgi:hypothetical protein